MTIENFYKGHSVESIFETLLTDSGYHVAYLGIEKIIRELRPLSQDEYVEITNKFEELKSLPDLVVLDLDENPKMFPTEIKYRTNLTQSLSRDIEKIKPRPFCLILVITGEEPWGKEGVIHHIKAFTIKKETQLNKDFFLEEYERIQDIFPKLSKEYDRGTIEKAENQILRICEGVSKQDIDEVLAQMGGIITPAKITILQKLFDEYE